MNHCLIRTSQQQSMHIQANTCDETASATALKFFSASSSKKTKNSHCSWEAEFSSPCCRGSCPGAISVPPRQIWQRKIETSAKTNNSWSLRKTLAEIAENCIKLLSFRYAFLMSASLAPLATLDSCSDLSYNCCWTVSASHQTLDVLIIVNLQYCLIFSHIQANSNKFKRCRVVSTS